MHLFSTLKMKNLKEFKELIEKYKSITLEQVKELFVIDGIWPNAFDVANSLTGFGSTHTCSLCKVITEEPLADNFPKCNECVWSANESNHYNCCTNHETYQAIDNAESSEELFEAFQERAKYMEEFLSNL